MNQIVFEDKQSFTRAAFNEVTRIVTQHSASVLECLAPTFNTQQCLEHLAFVVFSLILKLQLFNNFRSLLIIYFMFIF
ncbi:hypothetical protein DBL04_03860 [Acinetobacter seifertii]|nr:hypothetical protein DBL04_03860 [Acinetobacter seifertii]